MKSLILFFESLEEREKYTLLVGVIFVIIFIGTYVSILNYNSVRKLEKNLQNEISNYYELLKMAEIYASNKGSNLTSTTISISKIYHIASLSNIKDKLRSVRPISYQNKEAYELTIEKINPNELEVFINNIKKEKLNIYFITIDNIRQNNKLKVRMTIGM